MVAVVTIGQSPSPVTGRLASAYSGTVHNTTYDISSTFRLSSVTADQNGNISGQMTVDPPLYGSGPFTGRVSGSSVTFTVNSTPGNSIGVTHIIFSGTVVQAAMSGTYVVEATSGTQKVFENACW
jgi:hypothetical protein